MREEPDRDGIEGKDLGRGIIHMERRAFFAFIVMLINCASEIKTKSERMAVDAVKANLGITDDETTLQAFFDKRVCRKSGHRKMIKNCFLEGLLLFLFYNNNNNYYYYFFYYYY